MKREKSDTIQTSEDLDNFINNIDWKELRRKPKEIEKYRQKVFSYRGFEVFQHCENEDLFLIKNADFKRKIESYENKSIRAYKGDIIFYGWEDNIHFNTEKRRIKTIWTR